MVDETAANASIARSQAISKAESIAFDKLKSKLVALSDLHLLSNTDFINIINSGVSKGVALKKLASFLGISTEEIIAIGDGLNDISLLKTAGLAVAMGNAFPEVKRVADYITLDVDHSGVAAAVRKFLG